MIRTVADTAAWAAILALSVGIAWPYAFPRVLTSLRPHYWIGYVLTPIAFTHGWMAMKSGQARGASVLGMELATAALPPLLVQVAIGWNLRRAAGPLRRNRRRWHFAVMVAITLLVAGHLALVRW